MKQTAVISFILFFVWSFTGTAQDHHPYKLHSHNDYLQTAPFWEAYANQMESIEADVILKDNELFVAHEPESIKKDRTLTSLYLDPIRKAANLNLEGPKSFQLLIDIKTEPYATLKKLEEILVQYEDILIGDEGINVEIVVSGNRPSVAEYKNYSDYIMFDYQSISDTTGLPLDKIAMISLNFRSLSLWNGKGRLIDQEQEAIKTAIAVAHALNKPIRFWATPDSKTSWKALKDLGVDYINTDYPFEARAYLRTLDQRMYSRSKPFPVYQPTFQVDGNKSAVKNIIFMIGDGNGLAQISASLYANGQQLTLAYLKHMGLIKTHSADDFTTDSAAAGTALATGNKVKNRSIGINPDGSKGENLPEYLQQYRYLTGIVTTDYVTGATPAAFYAHQSDRDMVKEISADLVKSPLNLFIGGGEKNFSQNNQLQKLLASGFYLVDSLAQIGSIKEKKAGYFAAEEGLPTKSNGRGDYLSRATTQAISFLSKDGHPFFLMVEGAMIDSGGHNNDTETVIEEGIDFDQALAEALKFADKDGQTLVIITADHETGGITIPQGNVNQNQVELEFETEDHTGILVPIFAYGPHSDEFRGIFDNTDVFHKITEIIEKYYAKK
jgi:alkaline phosphatase